MIMIRVQLSSIQVSVSSSHPHPDTPAKRIRKDRHAHYGRSLHSRGSGAIPTR